MRRLRCAVGIWSIRSLELAPTAKSPDRFVSSLARFNQPFCFLLRHARVVSRPRWPKADETMASSVVGSWRPLLKASVLCCVRKGSWVASEAFEMAVGACRHPFLDPWTLEVHWDGTRSKMNIGREPGHLEGREEESMSVELSELDC
ncbi:hypothetical protein BJ508DRAFT_16745 [Ascobolus immersus RN42]|uniref:Uncharacterized protein n=1 Tax=Ascobolus immersus RN42 TaxID=1160509 RepID=A0A3N4HRU7_ASCIM|nr:hypothetical protein BJ508DRAFT_16745 [Ascobolus immersus RN42]